MEHNTNDSITDKKLTDLLGKYAQENAVKQPGENLELEFRFKLTRDAFEYAYKHALANKEFSKPILDCSVNIISKNVFERSAGGRDDEIQYIRRLGFDRGTPTTDVYTTKTRLTQSVQVNGYAKYSVGLAKESTIHKFNTSTNAILRFKIRVSFEYLGMSGHPHPAKWRFDFTAVKNCALSEMGNDLKPVRIGLFLPTLKADNLFEFLNCDLIDAFELEIEYIGGDTPVLADLHIAQKVFAMVNPQYITELAYREEIYAIAQDIIPETSSVFKQSSHGLKQLLNQVMALSKNTYYAEVYPPDGYFVTDKANGQRAAVRVCGGRCRVMLSDQMLQYDAEKDDGVTLCDAEFVHNTKLPNYKGSNPDGYTLYIFDVMVIRGRNVCAEGFESRVAYLEDCAEIITARVAPAGRAEPKKFKRVDPADKSRVFQELKNDTHTYVNEGVILTAPGSGYNATRNYKWKEYDLTTIDTLAVRCPQKLLGITPYITKPGVELYLLFVGINQQMREKLGLGFLPSYRSMFPDTRPEYYPIQFSPSIDPLAYIYYHDVAKNGEIDRQIIELSRSRDNAEWVFHQVRADRKLEKNYFGNDFRVAELTYMNYIDPFEYEALWEKPNSYFTKRADDIYTAPNKLKRFVISTLLRDNLSGSKWVIDEAAGRGGDLHRYQEIGVGNVLFIDIDPTAIAELVRRKFAFFAAKRRHVRNWVRGKDPTKITETKIQYDRVRDIQYEKLVVKDAKSMTVHTLVADLKTPHRELAASTQRYGLYAGLCDGIVCNFALHYMCDTLDHMRNLLLFNAKMLKIGGVFIFTVMDGLKIFELLKDMQTGQQWESRENGVLKYAIRKKYRGDKLAATGQTISVLLPFSSEMYQESLCNVETVVSEARKLGMDVEINSNMASFVERFAKADRSRAEKLTDDDKKYISLHTVVSVRKVRELKSRD